jgi:hypothetical protein
MILHCSKKLAAKLPHVSQTPLQETSPLGSWHGHLVLIDRRQCLLLCHDASRFMLFLPGVLKEDFMALNARFRELFALVLAQSGCTELQIRKVGLALGPLACDTVTDRSVQGAIRIAKEDIESWLWDTPNVLQVDPVAASCQLNERPTTIRGKWLWPRKVMLEIIADIR